MQNGFDFAAPTSEAGVLLIVAAMFVTFLILAKITTMFTR